MTSNNFKQLKPGNFDYGIAIFPSDEMVKAAEKIVKLLESKNIELIFKLDNTHLPHITLFQGSFLSDPKDELEKLAKSLVGREVEITMDKQLYFYSIGNIFWNTNISNDLLSLHLDAIKIFRPLAEGRLMKQWIDRLVDPETDLDDEAKARVIKNGFAESGETHFLPHITLGRLANKSDWEKIKNINLNNYSFPVSRIIGGPLGYHGNIKKIKIDIKI